MTAHFRVHTSNKIEFLFRELKQNLFENSDPFAERLLVVPSSVMRSHLLFRMAIDPDLRGAMGVKITYLQTVLKHLTKYPPPQMELAFAIEAKLKKNPPMPLNTSQLTGISDELAALFLRYYTYGAKFSGSSWQERLYRELIPSLDEASYPLPKRKFQLHLFGLNYLSLAELQLLERLPAVDFYLISPCAHYWGDLPSDREWLQMVRRMEREGASERSVEEMENFLQDRHPLLANWGRLGRKMERQLRSEEREGESYYATPSEDTVLGKMQADLLEMRQPDKYAADESLRIFAAESRYSEVESLYHTLCALIETKRYSPRDIVVMAPTMGDYLPYLQAHFSDLPLTLFEEEEGETSPLILLLSLSETRFSVESVFRVLEELHIYSKEELSRLKEWSRETKITWGRDSAHRSELTGSATTQEEGTWESGFKGQLVRFVTECGVNFAEQDLLYDWMQQVRSLHECTAPFKRGSEKLLSEWTLHLEKLIDTHLEENEESQELLQRLKAIDDISLTWDTLHYQIEKVLQERRDHYNEKNIDSIRCTSMQPMRTVPAKVIALLGLSHEEFPRKEIFSPLDLLPKGVRPTKEDFDRYLLLETLVTAEEVLLLSYVKEPSILLTELMNSYGLTPEKIVIKRKREEKSTRFFSEFVLKMPPPGEITLRTEDLFRAAKNPLQLYLKQGLQITERKKELLAKDDSFFLDGLSRYQLKMSSLKDPAKKPLPDIPEGIFKDLFMHDFEKELTESQRLLENEKIFSVHFTEGIKELGQVEENKFLLPPLQLGPFHLVGEVDHLTRNGAIVYGKKELATLWSSWPKMLLINKISTYLPLKKQLLFLKSNEVVPFDISQVDDWLKRFLDYTWSCREAPVPLQSEWLEAILREDEEIPLKEQFWSRNLSLEKAVWREKMQTVVDWELLSEMKK